jgi:GTPase SAR1 family protein
MHFCPDVPFILVGTKIDARSETDSKNVITAERGEELAKKLNAIRYMECSAKTSVCL